LKSFLERSANKLGQKRRDPAGKRIKKRSGIEKRSPSTWKRLRKQGGRYLEEKNVLPERGYKPSAASIGSGTQDCWWKLISRFSGGANKEGGKAQGIRGGRVKTTEESGPANRGRRGKVAVGWPAS